VVFYCENLNPRKPTPHSYMQKLVEVSELVHVWLKRPCKSWTMAACLACGSRGI